MKDKVASSGLARQVHVAAEEEEGGDDGEGHGGEFTSNTSPRPAYFPHELRPRAGLGDEEVERAPLDLARDEAYAEQDGDEVPNLRWREQCWPGSVLISQREPGDDERAEMRTRERGSRRALPHRSRKVLVLLPR